ncbi:hypothetical protein F2Q68_00017100 [Brassica cretica]|uniref:Uncharacterized protein n=1 Tax=Brassica cretica TaxID=69181 RepID=A0A8S9HIS6_BRACR|nr:hypothetical protein F2Q68_00017100 [Brassica cretica]
MTNDNNNPINTTDVTTTPLNVAATDATVTTAGNITASTAAATTSTSLPVGNATDETTRRSLFGDGLIRWEEMAPHTRAAAAVQPARRGLGLGLGSWVLFILSKVLNEIRESLEEEVSELNFPRSPRDSRPCAAAVAGSGSSPSL